MKNATLFLLAALAVSAAACSAGPGSENAPIDAGSIDAGSTDAGTPPRFESRQDACTQFAARQTTCGSTGATLAQDCVADTTMADDALFVCAACVIDSECSAQVASCADKCSFGVSVTGSGFAAQSSDWVYVQYVPSTGTPVGDVGPKQIGVDGTFAMEKGFKLGTQLQVRVWADQNADGVCGSDDDLEVLTALPALMGPAVVKITPASTKATELTPFCKAFDMAPRTATIMGDLSSLSPAVPDGSPVVVWLTMMPNPVASTEQHTVGQLKGTVQNNAFTVTFPPTVIRNTSYQVQWFIDSNNDAHCDRADVTGPMKPFSPKAVNVTVTVTPMEDRTTCAEFEGYGYDYTLSFAPQGLPGGARAQAIILGGPSKFPVGPPISTTTAATGALSFDFPDIGAGFDDLSMVFYVDIDGDGACTKDNDAFYLYEMPLLTGPMTDSPPALPAPYMPYSPCTLFQ